jgi:hypothetical protein
VCMWVYIAWESTCDVAVGGTKHFCYYFKYFFWMGGVAFLWNFWKSLSCIMVVLSSNIICSSVVMFDSSSIFRYLWLSSIGSL